MARQQENPKHRSRETRTQNALTLEDVARAAGVSTATVSRCLNSPEQVTEKTRDRVLAVVRETGYAPNFGARALAAKRTNTIGAIIPTMENAIFARGLQAFQEELAEHGLTLLVASSGYRPEMEDEQIRTLLARGADALMLIGFDRAEDSVAYLSKRNVPVVVSWAYRAGAAIPSVGFDNRLAMKALADRVIDLGHRDIAVITAPREANDRARERVTGVREAVAEAGLDPDAITIIETPYSIEKGREAMAALLARTPRPTVVMCGNDVLAAGAVQAAKRAGLRIPQDISITGFDDIELAQIVDPELTTVHVPHRKMGKETARQIAASLKHGNAPQGCELATEIVMRGSLGAWGT